MNTMPSFAARLNYAARIICERGPTSRRFDDCFENGDGDQIVAALVERSTKNPRLSENLPRYVAQTSIDAARTRLAEPCLFSMA